MKAPPKVEDMTTEEEQYLEEIYNNLNTIYHDRGDPSGYDFETAAITTDGTWNDLDLSSVVPAGAKAVALVVFISDNLVNQQLRFRKNGNSNERNVSSIVTQVAAQRVWGDIIVACDLNRVIEYNGTNTAFAEIFIVVKGWWK